MSVLFQPRSGAEMVVFGATALAAITLMSLSGPPAVEDLGARLTAAVSGQLSEFGDILSATHDEVMGSHQAIIDDYQDMVATRRQVAKDVAATVKTGETGSGQIQTILATAQATLEGDREAVVASHMDIHADRQEAVNDIGAIIKANYDGSTVVAVKAIVDTAKMDNAINRSQIAADLQENTSTRKSTLSADAAVRQSARAGEIDKRDAVAENSATRKTAHSDIKATHVDMVNTHQEIKATRKQAAGAVGSTVKNAHPSQSG